MISIRELRPEDEAPWRTLWAGYLDYYKTELPEAHTRALFQRLLAGAPHFAFVAEQTAPGESPQVIGFVHGMPHGSTWSEGGYCYLEDLFVDAKVRGSGAGRALIEAVYAEADKRGCTRVYWHTEAGNETARSLYDKLAVKSDFVQYRRS